MLGIRNHVCRVRECRTSRWGLERRAEAADRRAGAFHDLGIWSAGTADYLPPSIALARAYLAREGLDDWAGDRADDRPASPRSAPLSRSRHPLVEIFRRGRSRRDVSLGIVRRGLPVSFVGEIKRALPNAGFHWRLIRTGRAGAGRASAQSDADLSLVAGLYDGVHLAISDGMRPHSPGFSVIGTGDDRCRNPGCWRASCSPHWRPVMAAEPGAAPPAAAPADASQKLTLQRLFSSPDLAGARPRALKLSPDRTLLTSLKPRPDDRDRLDLWVLGAKTGKERMLVDSRRSARAPGVRAEKMQRERARIGGAQTQKKGSFPMIGLSERRVGPGAARRRPLSRYARRQGLAPDQYARWRAGPRWSARRASSSASWRPESRRSPLGGGKGEAGDRPPAPARWSHWGGAEFVALEEMDRTTGCGGRPTTRASRSSGSARRR